MRVYLCVCVCVCDSDEAAIRQNIYTAFEDIDVDQSGCIDVHEMTETLRKLGVEADDAQAREMMKIADIDDSGSVDKVCMCACVCVCVCVCLSLVLTFADIDDSGSVDTV